MGQFKPMVKMMTTEPSVELKLKKGGSVKSMTKMKSGGDATDHKKMANGGAMAALSGTPALIGRPAVNAPVRSPGKPSMASRRKAMAAKPKAAPATPMMKKGGESKAAHMAEMKAIKDVKSEVKSHASKPASKAHKGLKTGGVALGQGGYKKGGDVKKYAKGGLTGNGIINTENQGGAYRNTKMHTAEYTGKTSGKTGGVKDGNAGGYATGGVALGQGGYKDGGKAKKAYAAGGTVDSGHPVAMPQGRKKPSTPVSINQLSGTFKKGGSVTPAQGRLQKTFAKENAPAMKAAKAQSNEVYSKYGKMKMAEGGEMKDMSKGAYDASKRHSMELEDALNPLSMVKEMASKARDAFKKMPDKSSNMKGIKPEDFLQKMPEKSSSMKGMKSEDFLQKMPEKMRGQGAITETERSVTVSPAGKKRGGAC